MEGKSLTGVEGEKRADPEEGQLKMDDITRSPALTFYDREGKGTYKAIPEVIRMLVERGKKACSKLRRDQGYNHIVDDTTDCNSGLRPQGKNQRNRKREHEG